MESIIDHKTDGHAVANADKYIEVRGKRHLRQTMKGWHLCVKWKDGENPIWLTKTYGTNQLCDQLIGTNIKATCFYTFIMPCQYNMMQLVN